jgi:hypothetical protein
MSRSGSSSGHFFTPVPLVRDFEEYRKPKWHPQACVPSVEGLKVTTLRFDDPLTLASFSDVPFAILRQPAATNASAKFNRVENVV